MRPIQPRTNRATTIAADGPPLAGRARARGLAAAIVLVAAAAAGATGCDTQRKQDCDKFLPAIAPLQEGAPTPDAVDHVHDVVTAMKIEDQPLGVYAKNYANTLTVLSSTLKLKATAGPDGPPNGTEDVIKKNLKEVRTDFDDISRYCAP
jgi:hypothetical protein